MEGVTMARSTVFGMCECETHTLLSFLSYFTLLNVHSCKSTSRRASGRRFMSGTTGRVFSPTSSASRRRHSFSAPRRGVPQQRIAEHRRRTTRRSSLEEKRKQLGEWIVAAKHDSLVKEFVRNVRLQTPQPTNDDEPQQQQQSLRCVTSRWSYFLFSDASVNPTATR